MDLVSTKGLDADDLVYVFELVRHGARAPILDRPGFPVSKEMLTPMGMR